MLKPSEKTERHLLYRSPRRYDFRHCLRSLCKTCYQSSLALASLFGNAFLLYMSATDFDMNFVEHDKFHFQKRTNTVLL